MAYLIDVLTLAAILSIATQGYMLIKGLGGMLHLGHAVFYGLGAYGAAIVSLRLLPAGYFPVSVLAGGLVAAFGALLVGWPALKERGRYFMIVTFAIQLIFVTFVINLPITGGPDGLSSIPGISFGPWQPTSRSTVELGPLVIGYRALKCIVMLGFAAVTFTLCRRLINSPYGRLVRAVREDELAVEAYGRATTPVKLSIFMIGAGITGIAGALFAHHFNYVGPTQFELDATILFLVMLIVGGQYSLWGATIGTLLMVALLEVLRFLLEDVLSVPFELTAHLRQVVFALTLIVVLVLRSKGLVPERLRRYRRQTTAEASPEQVDEFADTVHMVAPKALSADATTVASSASSFPTADPPVLRASGLRKQFGGVLAVADAGLSLHKGRIIAVIGPNGAGKTSLFNIVSGFGDAEAGEVELKGESILGKSAAQIARRGLARTFQDVRTWRGLTAIENILVCRPGQPGTNPLNVFGRPITVADAEAANIGEAFQLLERFGLQHFADTPAEQLSYAQRKMLAIARVTAFQPDVVLLDEPTSGVDPRRLDTFLAHIRALAVHDQRAVCIIEHNMNVVRDIADWVVFMDQGRTLAAGRPQDVLGDRHLMQVYLGHRELERMAC